MIIEITIELHCNLKKHKSGFSHENIEKNSFILQNIPPKMLLFCIFWYTVDPY